MLKQQLFKDRYVTKLKQDISSGASVDHYRSGNFVYDKTQTLIIPNIEAAPMLLTRLDDANDDFNSAVSIYEAFKDLKLIQAADPRLWVYLAHVDLYPYMIKRWDDAYLGKSSNPSKYILDHWFLASSAQSSLLRHALSGLWWAVYLSVDESKGEEKYELTKILFRQLDFPTRTLGTYKLGRHKEAVLGILEFIHENEPLFAIKFEDKTRFVTKHLNIIGGIKPIAYFDRHFFKSELAKISDQIANL